MTIKIIFLLALSSGLVGVVLGYLLRILIALSKKGGIEHQIKGMILKAQEDAKKVTLEAETKATETLKATREDIKEKEEKLKKDRGETH